MDPALVQILASQEKACVTRYTSLLQNLPMPDSGLGTQRWAHNAS